MRLIRIAIANVNDRPDLYRVTTDGSRHWIALKLNGTISNRDAIGARVHIVAGGTDQWQEVRGGGSTSSRTGEFAGSDRRRRAFYV